LNPDAGVHGALQTLAPRAWAYCMMAVSDVDGVALAEVELAEVMWLRSRERPMPLFVETMVLLLLV